MNFFDVFLQSLGNVRSNLLRAVLTLMIIACGIAAVVGILTAIDTAIYSMSSNFSSLGSNSFKIKPTWTETGVTVRGRKRKESTPISYEQANEFKERFDLKGRVSVSFQARGNLEIGYKDKETTPQYFMIGVDENDHYTHGDEISAGRFFGKPDVMSGSAQVIVGSDLVKEFFNGNAELAIDEKIVVDGMKLKIVGVIAEKGASMNQQSDKKLLIPITLARQKYAHAKTNYNLAVSVNSTEDLDEIVMESTGLMRKVRRLKSSEENDFEAQMSGGIVDIIKEDTIKFRMAAVLIGLITLLGAAIGLMNIMLVSVTERTKEVGIIKALGANRSTILKMFLLEAIIICQMGGILGIILGLAAGYGVSYAFDSDFIIPWAWILLGIVLCMIVGLISGIYPALKASKLDPIDCLRYE